VSEYPKLPIGASIDCGEFMLAMFAKGWDSAGVASQREGIMRKLVIAAAITAAVALGGSAAWRANAAAPAAPVPQIGQYSPIHPVACGRPGRFCGPYRHHVCGPYGRHCWCAPC